jgi:hypothetical protein
MVAEGEKIVLTGDEKVPVTKSKMLPRDLRRQKALHRRLKQSQRYKDMPSFPIIPKEDGVLPLDYCGITTHFCSMNRS